MDLRRRKVCLGGRRKVFLWRRKVGISTRKVGFGLAVLVGVGVGISRVRNRGTGGRKVCRLGRRRKVCLGRRRNVFHGRGRNVFLWRRKVGIGTRKVVGVVLGLAFVWGVSISGREIGLRRRRKVRRLGRRSVCLGRRKKVFLRRRKVGIATRMVDVGRVRNGDIGGRVSLRRRKGSIGRERRDGLGRRRNKTPLVREWRERAGSRKADKNECRDDFQLHIVFFLQC